MLNLIKEAVRKSAENDCFEFYGIRVDEGRKYEVGETTEVSHQLYQDPMFDEKGHLYPRIESGVSKGLYDAGELNGTCAYQFDPEDEESIETAYKKACNICGSYIGVIAGNYGSYGYDEDEIIIRDAVVIFSADNK